MISAILCCIAGLLVIGNIAYGVSYTKQTQNPFSRWTPLRFGANLAAWHPSDLASQTLNRQGPSWPSQPSQTHARGLTFNGTDNEVDLGNTPLYDDTSVGMTITCLIELPTANSGSKNFYSESSTASDTQFLRIMRSGTSVLKLTVKNDAGGTTVNTNVTATIPNGYSVVSTVLDNAATGWGMIQDGTAIKALGEAYAGAPATTTLNQATIGRLNAGFPERWDKSVAYVIRHASALTLAQCRQVQQYIADAVAADITLTIAGSETANSNTPQDDWPFDENADGKELANSGSASTVGQRFPGDTISDNDDLGPNDDDLAQSTEADQPRFLADGFAAGLPGREHTATGEWLDVTFTSTLSQPFLIGIVYKCPDWLATTFCVLFDDVADLGPRVFRNGSTVAMSAPTNLSMGAHAGLAGTHVLLLEFNGTSCKAYLDGGANLVDTTDIGTGTMAGLTLGTDNAQTAATEFVGLSGDVVAVDGAQTNATKDSLGNFLAEKAGTTWVDVA